MLLLSGASNNDVINVNKLADNIPKQESVTEGQSRSPKQEKKVRDVIEKEVRIYFEDIPELVEVAKCESHFRHTDKDGNLIRGEANDSDIGVMQINVDYHLETAKEMGFDIYSLRGNMAYARHLYEKQGIQPWSSSHPCWNKSVAKIQKDQKELAMNK